MAAKSAWLGHIRTSHTWRYFCCNVCIVSMHGHDHKLGFISTLDYVFYTRASIQECDERHLVPMVDHSFFRIHSCVHVYMNTYTQVMSTGHAYVLCDIHAFIRTGLQCRSHGAHGPTQHFPDHGQFFPHKQKLLLAWLIESNNEYLRPETWEFHGSKGTVIVTMTTPSKGGDCRSVTRHESSFQATKGSESSCQLPQPLPPLCVAQK